jgi:sortase A
MEAAQSIRVTADAMQIEPVIVAPIVAIPMLLILLIGVLIPKPKKRRFD